MLWQARLFMSGENLTSGAGSLPAGPAERTSGGAAARLEARAALLRSWNWESVVKFNRGACERGFTRHAPNPESIELVRQRWEQTCHRELTLAEALDFLFVCHRDEPFVFFSGPTFAEVARRIVDAQLADLSLDRRREAVHVAAEYVEGNLDRETAVNVLAEMCGLVCFQAGDRVRTLKGTRHGVVRRLLPDGRLVWRPDGGSVELMAPLESLLRESPEPRPRANA